MGCQFWKDLIENIQNCGQKEGSKFWYVLGFLTHGLFRDDISIGPLVLWRTRPKFCVDGQIKCLVVSGHKAHWGLHFPTKLPLPKYFDRSKCCWLKLAVLSKVDNTSPKKYVMTSSLKLITLRLRCWYGNFYSNLFHLVLVPYSRSWTSSWTP